MGISSGSSPVNSTGMIKCSKCGAELRIGDWPFCTGDPNAHGRPHGGTLLAAIHPSDRCTILRNPRTGEVRFPPRNDTPIHPKYAAQGFIKEEIRTPQEMRAVEKQTGKVHERSWYDPGSGRADRDMTSHVGD